MKKVRYNPRAETDLVEIWDYIAKDDRDKASNFIYELTDKFELLAENPSLGRDRGDILPGFRLFPYRRYLIFYIQINSGIEIVRVLHSARDVESEFEM